MKCHYYAILSFLSVLIGVGSTAHAQSERELHIQHSGELRVCIWPDYFSISYKNTKTGMLEGLDIELANELSRDLNVRTRFISTRFGAFMDDLEKNKCDIAMFGVGRTRNRMSRVDFSTPYLSSGLYGVTLKTHPTLNHWNQIDQPGVIVSVQKGSYMEGVMNESLKYAHLKAVSRHAQREIEIRSGRADVFITDYPYSQKVASLYDWAKILTPEHETKRFEYAYAIKKGQPEWLKRINQFVADIKSDGRLLHHASTYNLTPVVIKK